MLSQAELLEKIRPLWKRDGAIYRKNKNVFARPAKPGEIVYTHTADGLETANTAAEGDFIVRNQTGAGEAYIVPANKFSHKYARLRPAGEGWDEYTPLGHIIAVELSPERLTELGLPDTFEFMAAWGQAMIAKAGDYLGGPVTETEVYRIAHKEFGETYVPAG